MCHLMHTPFLFGYCHKTRNAAMRQPHRQKLRQCCVIHTKFQELIEHLEKVDKICKNIRSDGAALSNIAQEM